MRLSGRSPAWPLLAAQVATAVTAAFLAWLMRGRLAAIAALFGGVIVIIPAAWFAFKTWSPPGRSGAAQIVGSMYRAELGKLLLTAVLFWIGVVQFGDQFASLMITCTACLSMNWLMLAVARFS